MICLLLSHSRFSRTYTPFLGQARERVDEHRAYLLGHGGRGRTGKGPLAEFRKGEQRHDRLGDAVVEAGWPDAGPSTMCASQTSGRTPGIPDATPWMMYEMTRGSMMRAMASKCIVSLHGAAAACPVGLVKGTP